MTLYNGFEQFLQILSFFNILRSVDFWGRKCVKTALLYCVHRMISPSLSGASHAIPSPQIYTIEYKLLCVAKF